MYKRGNRLFIVSVSSAQILIVLLSIFALSFLFSEIEIVGALDTPSAYGTSPVPIEAAPTPPPGAGPTAPPATDPATGGTVQKFVSDIYGGQAFGGGFAGSLTAGLAWGATLALVVKFVAPALGASEALTDALVKSVFIGSVAGGAVAGLVGEGTLFSLSAQNAGALAGFGVGVAVFLLTYKDEEKERVIIEFYPYEPPIGGNDCEVCNDDEFRPCSEYRCRSLGQACELVNSGTVEEKCVWVNPGDVTSPTITPWDEPLTAGHRYASHNTRPPSLGTRVINENNADGCLQAFTPLTFGIITNEPAQCKINIGHTETYEEMEFFFGETNHLIEEHRQRLSLPGPDAGNGTGAPEIAEGDLELHVRCQDANGNVNVDEFVFAFCVDPSPDTTPPIIVDTSIPSGSPVAFESGEALVEVYVNEPAECKWDIQDTNFEDMEHSMTCATDPVDINAQLLYTCSTTFTGVKDREENTYYMRCKDLPGSDDSERNVNVQSTEFVLRGTEPLNIIESGPNGTISDSTDVVPVVLTVETSNGADEGRALCYFSETGEEGSFIAMFETDNFAHRQTLSLSAGNYEYFLRCIDAGGNADEAQVEFSVEVDTQAPMITRAYRDLDALKIVTDEDAQCVYSLNSCNYNFDEGIALIYSNPSIQTNHFAPWEATLTYHIKCQDDFGNEPAPNACSLIASATNIV